MSYTRLFFSHLTKIKLSSIVFERSIQALANASITMIGTSNLSVVPYAKGHMAADITPFTELSPENLAQAVWAANITDNTDSGTMGSLLLASGGGSSPEVIAAAVWDELLNTHTVSGSFGERVQKLLTLSKFLGLK